MNSMNSMNSTNSQTKMFDSKDFKKYIMNMEEDITKVSNYYNYLTEKYDKKINNIVNRYEGRTNNLYIDLRRREGDYIKLSKKIDNIINKTYDNCYIDTKDIDYTYRIISLFLYMYTLFVIMMVISYFY
jgi:hypothetical protein